MLFFPRDRDKGEKIVMALKEIYYPSLIEYRKEMIEEVLASFDLVVALMAVGIVVRNFCSHLKNKWTDRPIVAIDSALSCAVPIVGGHHGANKLAIDLAKTLGLFPAITTATDSAGLPCLESIASALNAEIVNKESSKIVNLRFLREEVPILRLKGPQIVLIDEDVAVLKGTGLVVGIGTRKGVDATEVLEAIDKALAKAAKRREDIGVLATSRLKMEEKGIKEAARSLEREVIYLSDEVLNSQQPTTASRAVDLGLAGVAEPAVLALSSRLILPKKAFGRVTVALGE